MENNRKLRIGVDLDSTLIKMKAVEIASKQLGYPFTDKNAVVWNHHNFPEDLRAKIFSLFEDPKIMCENAWPIEGAQTRITQWTRAGHEVILITARNQSLHEGTRALVREHFPEITDVNFVGQTESKKSLMSEKKLDLWVDDAPHGVEDSLSLGIETYLISNNYTKYNWGARALRHKHPDKFHVVKLVYDIVL
jgi:hypothetical protein